MLMWVNTYILIYIIKKYTYLSEWYTQNKNGSGVSIGPGPIIAVDLIQFGNSIASMLEIDIKRQKNANKILSSTKPLILSQSDKKMMIQSINE